MLVYRRVGNLIFGNYGLKMLKSRFMELKVSYFSSPSKRVFASSESVDKALLTPAMQQYFAFKTDYKDYVLFFRLGDFYEFFFEDAIRVSEILGIALTTRGKYQGKDIPLCGIPYFTVDNYVKKIIKRGLKVAICEQTETTQDMKNTRKRKSPVLNRSIVRLITAGTLLEDAFLTPRCSNYLCSLSYHADSNRYGLSAIDISTGEFCVHNIEENEMPSLLARYDPKEILLPRSFEESKPSSIETYLECTNSAENEESGGGCMVTYVESEDANEQTLISVLEKHQELAALSAPLKNHVYSKIEIASIGTLLQYIQSTQMGSFPRIFLDEEKGEGMLYLDRNTRNSLNLIRGSNESVRGSVLSTIDHTVSVMGSRLLSNRLSSPITNVDIINKRLDLLSFFMSHSHIPVFLKPLLKQLSDSERSFQRILLKRGSPQDLGCIRDMLRCYRTIEEYFEKEMKMDGCSILESMLQCCQSYSSSSLYELLESSLKPELPFSLSDGDYIKEGYSKELDEWKQLENNTTSLLSQIQKRYVAKSGIARLKVKWTEAIGFFVEVPSTSTLQDTSFFYPYQMMKGHYRYKTAELNELDNKRYQASGNIKRIEVDIYNSIREEIAKNGLWINKCNSILSILDVNCSLAEVSSQNGYHKPLLDNSRELDLEDMRHLVVEDLMMRQKKGKTFIPNSIHLSSEDPTQKMRSCILTGPNMGGKTTFLRSVALCVILSQMGCFIPAREGRIGVIDKIFSRVGSADDITNNRSTFYSEIAETTSIIHNATSRSLLLIDELGRGTSVEEGVAIAYSVLEYIHKNIRCKTLFATHYRKVTELASTCSGIENFKMCAIPTKDSLLLSYKLEHGISDQSYGLFIARMVGIPEEIIQKAMMMVQKSRDEKEPILLSSCLNELDINAMTPLKAMLFLNELKQVLNTNKEKGLQNVLHALVQQYKGK